MKLCCRFLPLGRHDFLLHCPLKLLLLLRAGAAAPPAASASSGHPGAPRASASLDSCHYFSSCLQYDVAAAALGPRQARQERGDLSSGEGQIASFCEQLASYQRHLMYTWVYIRFICIKKELIRGSTLSQGKATINGHGRSCHYRNSSYHCWRARRYFCLVQTVVREAISGGPKLCTPICTPRLM